LSGIFLNLRNETRVVVSITLLQRSVAVEINRQQVLPDRPQSGRPTEQMYLHLGGGDEAPSSPVSRRWG
jgi:hypothetical protein